MKNKLVRAWLVFILLCLVFVVGVEFYHRTHKDASSAFRCRILINRDLIVDSSEKKKEVEIKKNDEEESLYEKTQYGMLPKISKNGERVYDRFSAKTLSKRYVKLAVALNQESIDMIIGLLSKLGSDKITFIVPSYIDAFVVVVNTILEHGHEVFLLLPTQNLVSDNQAVSPFLANSGAKETQDKLLNLLATVKGIIGVANITPSLITKSAKDMEVIILELAKRGLAFFDAQMQNDMLSTIAQKTGAVYLHVGDVYSVDKTKKLKEYTTYFVPFKQVDAFMNLRPKGVALAPISQEKVDE